MITSGCKEESISELVGEVIYDCRIKNPDVNLRAIAIGKWGNFHDCHQLESRFNEKFCPICFDALLLNIVVSEILAINP